MATTDLAPAPAGPSRPRPYSLREWLSPSIPGDAVLSWLGPLLVTVFAGYLRFHRLGTPKTVVFDETYYAKDSLALLKFGWEHNTVKDADKLLIADRHANIWADGPSFVAHPPMGKWMIAVGEAIFGATPFGWRFVPALCGTLSVLILCRVARRMTGSTLLGCGAGLLLALDGLEFVTSRAALLDIFVMFWILAGFACLVNDRDRSRRRLADKIQNGDASAYGPYLLHGWRIAAGVCLGLACATKWTGIFYIAAFGIMVVIWDYGARRAAGAREPALGTLLLDAGPAFLQLVVVALAAYLASWWGWIFRPGGWGRGDASGNLLWRPFEAMPKLWNYHKEMLSFHTHLDAKHPYQSWPWDWPILRRPVAFYYTEPKNACGAGTRCSQEILGIGTPALWWGALLALITLVAIWIVKRDWRAGAILLGFLAGWLTWFPSAFADRTMFLFYATPMIPFMVLAIVLVLGYLIGPATSGTGGAHALGVPRHEFPPPSPPPAYPPAYHPLDDPECGHQPDFDRVDRVPEDRENGLPSGAGSSWDQPGSGYETPPPQNACYGPPGGPPGEPLEPHYQELYYEPYYDEYYGGRPARSPVPARAAVGSRRVVGAAAAGAFMLVVLANFAYFYPILAAEILSYEGWRDRIWFGSWI